MIYASKHRNVYAIEAANGYAIEAENGYAIDAAKKRSTAICADVEGPGFATVSFTAVTVRSTRLPCKIEHKIKPKKMEATEMLRMSYAVLCCAVLRCAALTDIFPGHRTKL